MSTATVEEKEFAKVVSVLLYAGISIGVILGAIIGPFLSRSGMILGAVIIFLVISLFEAKKSMPGEYIWRAVK